MKIVVKLRANRGKNCAFNDVNSEIIRRKLTKFVYVCKNDSKLIGYHNNVSSTTAKIISVFIICIHQPTNAEKLVKFGPVLAEIFGMICRFLPSRPKRYRNSLRELCG